MSELKRVAFSTFASGSGTGNASCSGTISDNKKSTVNPTAAAFLQAQESLTLSSTSMLPPQVPFIGTAAGVGDSGNLVTEGNEGVSTAIASTSSQNQISKTFRLDLELFEVNASSFPEFNYNKLVHVEKKKYKKLSKVNGVLDPFEENDDDVARIAKELEKRYGTSCSNTGKGKRNNDDYYDKGAGYDESDSFIDNTEAYDEIIPEEVETVGGGFYINSGALEFKHLSNYERPEDAIKMPKAKKRALSTSSSSDDEAEDEIVVEITENASSKDSATAIKLKNGHMEKKVKTSTLDNSDKESNGKIKYKDKKLEKPTIQIKEEEACPDTSKEKDKEKSCKTTTIKDMLKAKRDNFRKMQEEDSNKIINGESIKDSDSSDSDTSAEDSETDDEPDEKKIRKGGDEECEKIRLFDAKLPADLTEDLLNDIEELKNVVNSAIPSGKSFQFDEKMIEIFLRIDDACSCFEKPIRNQIFSHIEYKLSIPKYFLLRKVKSLRIKQEKSKTKKAFMKLRKAVAEIMPSVLLNYESNCRKVDEIRAGVSSSELDKIEQLPKYPKKRFPWNETLRNLLYELFQVRWISFAVLRTRKETFDEFVNNYLREKVVPIWLPGWMKFEDLQKELEKRKISAKKPKENKKPGENISTLKTKDETNSLLSGKTSVLGADVAKSILSSSNAVSVVSTKDLVVTITTKNEKTKEVPNVSAQTNSVSITQVPIDGTSLLSNCAQNKMESSLSNSLPQKNQKSNSISSNNRSASNPLSSANLNHNSQKPTGQNSSNSNNKNSKKTSNENRTNDVSNNHQSSTISEKQNKSQTEILSPSKRATDHSINSIMSSNSSPTHHSSTPVSSPLSSLTAQGATSTDSKTTDTATTHVINVDNLKNTSDIINTSNQLLNSTNVAVNISSSSNGANSAATLKEGSIRIRTVANVNSSLEKERKNDHPNDVHSKSKAVIPINENPDNESSSESDGVEIVGVFPVMNKKSTNIVINKNKYRKESRTLPPNFNVQNQNKMYKPVKNSSNSNRDEVRTNSERLNMNASEVKDTELDVNQIMRALKELEEMQQSSIHISDGSPPTSNNISSGTSSHTSPISYGSPSVKKPSAS